MKAITIENDSREWQADMVRQSRWQWITLLSILGYEGVGAIVGGSLLIVAPDGRLMDMPVEMMHGLFSDFLIPGIILLGLGILNSVAFFSVLSKVRTGWVMAWLALSGLLVWFVIEIIILQELHWLHYMWGMPVVLGGLVAIPLIPARQEAMRKTFLVFGILSSLLYVAMNIFVPMQWQAYDSAAQVISELSAFGAPTRILWTLLGILYTFLMTTFGWGVLKSAGRNRALRIAGGLLIAYSVLGFIWPIAPMHLRETLAVGGATWSDTMHLALGAVTEILYLLALGFAATALGNWFRTYSIATFLVLLVFGFLTFLDAPDISTNQHTPLIGVWERINIGVFMLWTVVLATVLLRIEPPLTTANENVTGESPGKRHQQSYPSVLP